MVFSATLREWWNDTRLSWNPSNYGNIKSIYLKSDGANPNAWISDLIIREDSGDGLLSNLKWTD